MTGKMQMLHDEDQMKREIWELLDYDNGESGCPMCGRYRLCICKNGNHRCEKCNWCPEICGYATVTD